MNEIPIVPERKVFAMIQPSRIRTLSDTPHTKIEMECELKKKRVNIEVYILRGVLCMVFKVSKYFRY